MGTRHSATLAIIGAGFSGIGIAIQLRRAGITDFVILEKGAMIGGVWRDNTYPGAACDVPSHLYSFSFERRYRWTRVYSEQADIERYLRHCIEKYELAPHIRLNAEVASMRFDDTTGGWDIALASGETSFARIVITATGQLSRPLHPDIPGLKDFRGRIFHSARWDHQYDLRDKRVAVIGTGASAIQFVPPVAKLAAHLTLFQRSAAWIMPKIDHRLTRVQHRLFDLVPALYSVARAAIYGVHEFLGIGFVLWRPLMAPMRAAAALNLRFRIKDPELRRKLTPDYPMGCKRILFSNDFYPALARPNVRVVTEHIASIDAAGINTADGRHHAADAIILGTGFAANDFLAPIEVTGRKGMRLNDAWSRGAEAYLGMSVAGFPNFFMLYGPNTNLGHNSILYILESQFRYVVDAVRRVLATPGMSIDVKTDVQRRFNQRLQADLARTIWAAGCRSWYMNADGKLVNNWSGFTFTYRRRTRRFDAENYESVAASNPRPTGNPIETLLTESLAARLARTVVRAFMKPTFRPSVPIPTQRLWVELATRTLLVPRRVRFETMRLADLRAERITPKESVAAPSKTVLYFHGGAYILGSPRGYRSLTGRIAQFAGVTAWVPDYRLAPEHPFPAAIEDALACYDALLDAGIAPGNIVVAGDSAGGGLALALALKLRDLKRPLPAGLVLISPWVDLSANALTDVPTDPLLSEPWLRQGASAYLATTPADNPLASPIHADLRALPPTLVQFSGGELLHNDSLRLVTALRDAGVHVEATEYARLWHDFQLYAGFVPEATDAVQAIARFVQTRFGPEPSRH